MDSDKKQTTNEVGRTKWQLAQLAKKKCVVCGKRAASKTLKNGKKRVLTLCDIHRKDRAKRAIKRYYDNREAK